jgi:uncharacterized protein YceH (UPF0502 family)
MRLTLSGGAALRPAEARVLGCLVEKQRTTPDAYPLSLNALRLACNQSTNRDPVVDYDEATVREALHRLERSGVVRLASGAGSRAPKYRHLLADRLPLTRGEEAVVCVLLLRGAQTPGELKQRSERMHPFRDLADVHATLESLIGGELVERLDRRPGQKEERYRELLQERDGEIAQDVPAGAQGAHGAEGTPGAEGAHGGEGTLGTEGGAGIEGADRAYRPSRDDGQPSLHDRVARLEREVAELRAALAGEPRGGVAEGPPDASRETVAAVEGR